MRSHTDVRSSFTTRSGWPRSTPHNLARAIATGAGYARADDEAHALIRTALAGSGDIIPDHDQGTLHIRLDPLPAPRHATHRNFRKSMVWRAMSATMYGIAKWVDSPLACEP